MPPQKAPSKRPSLLDPRLVKALKDPTRAMILNAMSQRPASATQLGRAWEIPASNLHYHVGVLLDLNCIEEVYREKKRAAEEIFYRATVQHYFNTEAWMEVPEDDRLGLAVGVVKLMVNDLDEGIHAETVCADDVVLSRHPMKLDAAGYMEAQAIMEAAEDEILEVRERATKRLIRSGEKPRITKVSLIQVETPDAKLT